MRLLIPILCLTFISSFGFNQTEHVKSFLKWEMRNNKQRGFLEFRIGRKKINKNITPWYSTNCFVQYCSNSLDSNEDFNSYFYRKELKILDSIFTTKDKDYFLKEISKNKDTIWEKLSSAKIISPKSGLFSSNKNFYSFSNPLFSQDGKYVIVSKSFYCGWLCAWGGTYIYTKKGRKWKLLACLNAYIS